MIFKKQGFPEEGDLVLCTVTSVQYHSVFVDLDAFDKGGMIHISEVAPGRIRNIRDFVKEGKKVVCKVLRINQEKGYIDLSLRRVNESEKRRKVDDVKREQNAEKIVEIAAEKMKLKTEQLYNQIWQKISQKYASLHQFFEDVSKDMSLLSIASLEPKQQKILEDIVSQRIKPSEVEINGKLKIVTYAPNGIEIIKDSMAKALEATKGMVSIKYLGSGMYRFLVKAPDYKEAERIMKNATDSAMTHVTKNSGTAEFSRESP